MATAEPGDGGAAKEILEGVVVMIMNSGGFCFVRPLPPGDEEAAETFFASLTEALQKGRVDDHPDDVYLNKRYNCPKKIARRLKRGARVRYYLEMPSPSSPGNMQGGAGGDGSKRPQKPVVHVTELVSLPPRKPKVATEGARERGEKKRDGGESQSVKQGAKESEKGQSKNEGEREEVGKAGGGGEPAEKKKSKSGRRGRRGRGGKKRKDGTKRSKPVEKEAEPQAATTAAAAANGGKGGDGGGDSDSVLGTTTAASDSASAAVKMDKKKKSRKRRGGGRRARRRAKRSKSPAPGLAGLPIFEISSLLSTSPAKKHDDLIVAWGTGRPLRIETGAFLRDTWPYEGSAFGAKHAEHDRAAWEEHLVEADIGFERCALVSALLVPRAAHKPEAEEEEGDAKEEEKHGKEGERKNGKKGSLNTGASSSGGSPTKDASEQPAVVPSADSAVSGLRALVATGTNKTVVIIDYMCTRPSKRGHGYGDCLLDFARSTILPLFVPSSKETALYVVSTDSALPYWLRKSAGMVPCLTNPLGEGVLESIFDSSDVEQYHLLCEATAATTATATTTATDSTFAASSTTIDKKEVAAAAAATTTTAAAAAASAAAAAAIADARGPPVTALVCPAPRIESSAVSEAGAAPAAASASLLAAAWSDQETRPHDPPADAMTRAFGAALTAKGLQEHGAPLTVAAAPLRQCVATAAAAARTLAPFYYSTMGPGAEEAAASAAIVIDTSLLPKALSPTPEAELKALVASEGDGTVAVSFCEGPTPIGTGLPGSLTLLVAPPQRLTELMPVLEGTADAPSLVLPPGSFACFGGPLDANGRLSAEDEAGSWRALTVTGVLTANDSYEADEADELSVSKGDRVLKLKTRKDAAEQGWQLVARAGVWEQGHVPEDYVE
eukprot:UC1_evm1s1960